jgi:hypothetical protein
MQHNPWLFASYILWWKRVVLYVHACVYVCVCVCVCVCVFFSCFNDIKANLWRMYESQQKIVFQLITYL